MKTAMTSIRQLAALEKAEIVSIRQQPAAPVPENAYIVAVTHDGGRFATWAPGEGYSLYDGNQLRPLPGITAPHQRREDRAMFSLDGSRLLIADAENNVSVIDVNRGVHVFAHATGVARADGGVHAALSPDGNRIAISVYVHAPDRLRQVGLTVWQFDASRNSYERTCFWDAGAFEERVVIADLLHYPGPTAVCFSANGENVIVRTITGLSVCSCAVMGKRDIALEPRNDGFDQHFLRDDIVYVSPNGEGVMIRSKETDHRAGFARVTSYGSLTDGGGPTATRSGFGYGTSCWMPLDVQGRQVVVYQGNGGHDVLLSDVVTREPAPGTARHRITPDLSEAALLCAYHPLSRTRVAVAMSVRNRLFRIYTKDMYRSDALTAVDSVLDPSTSNSYTTVLHLVGRFL